MKPCPAEAAADACEDLAMAMDRGSVDDRRRTSIAAVLYWVPNTHPRREGADEVLQMARAIESGTATTDDLCAFAVKLRAGAEKMRSTGWYGLLHGVESMAAKGES